MGKRQALFDMWKVNMNACAICTQPAQVTLCRTCTAELAQRLRTVPTVLGQLDITRSSGLTRPDALGVARRSTTGSLPVHLDAAETARDLASVLETWARELAPGEPDSEAHSGVQAALRLLDRVENIAAHPDAEQIVDEIQDAITRAWRAVDQPAQHTFLGPCPHCGADLYTPPGRAHVQCGCGQTTDTSERRDWLLEQVRDQLDTASGIARALPGLLPIRLTPSMIRGYAHRGRLAARPALADGKPRYRIGDVLDVLGMG